MFITFIFLANILLLVQPSEAYRGHTNDEIRLMDECSDEPYIREHLGEDDYMSLIDACVEERLCNIWKHLVFTFNNKNGRQFLKHYNIIDPNFLFQFSSCLGELSRNLQIFYDVVFLLASEDSVYLAA
ncbi:ATP-dependent RNA helicase DDX19B [Trichinella spiralis]|uniref:ATP-dependent RNA helicase DDX19B n=1 Tax=Trichinella spiralis TaxID=6334 RepID=UPI0001EFC850|nr:ATP-dependent RNA helicase DDX19B [Trichinella spiralis]